MLLGGVRMPKRNEDVRIRPLLPRHTFKVFFMVCLQIDMDAKKNAV
jgi:hypothetical protein